MNASVADGPPIFLVFVSFQGVERCASAWLRIFDLGGRAGPHSGVADIDPGGVGGLRRDLSHFILSRLAIEQRHFELDAPCPASRSLRWAAAAFLHGDLSRWLMINRNGGSERKVSSDEGFIKALLHFLNVGIQFLLDVSARFRCNSGAASLPCKGAGMGNPERAY
jgi:hypothetical protein